MRPIIALGKKMSLLLPKCLQRAILRSYRRFLYFGFRYKCVFCGAHLRMFLPAGFTSSVLKEYDIIGGGYRDNVRCPHCNSSNRERAMYLYLNYRGVLSAPDLQILHIAPERSLQKKLKSKAGPGYVSGDIGSPYADMVMDVVDIPFSAGHFDIAICSHVLEHVPDDVRAFREFYRTLKSGGLALIQVPISANLQKTFEDWSVVREEDRYRVFGQTDHVRIYGQDYLDRGRSVGFEAEAVSVESFLSAGEIEKYALDRRELLFVFVKAFAIK